MNWDWSQDGALTQKAHSQEDELPFSASSSSSVQNEFIGHDGQGTSQTAPSLSLSPSKKRRYTAPSDSIQKLIVDRFFKKVKCSDDPNGYQYQCTIGDCTNKYSSSTASSNHRDHVMNKHQEEYNGFVEMKTSMAPKGNQIKITSLFSPSTPYSKEKLECFQFRLLDWVVRAALPFTTVDHPSFRSWVYSIDPRMIVPASRTLRSKLPFRCNQLMLKLKKALASIDRCAITTDAWSSRSNSPFLSITAHWVTSEYELKSAVLGLQSFEHPHTAEATTDVIRKFIVVCLFILCSDSKQT